MRRAIRSAGDPAGTDPRASEVDRHSYLLDQCASFGLVDRVYSQLVTYGALSKSSRLGQSWSQRQETNILFAELKETFQAICEYLEDSLLAHLRTSERKADTIQADHKARLIEGDFYQLFQDVIFEQLVSEGHVRGLLLPEYQFGQVPESHVEQMCQHVVGEAFAGFMVNLPPLGTKRKPAQPNNSRPSQVPSLPLLRLAHQPTPPSDPPDRTALASRCSISDIYSTPRGDQSGFHTTRAPRAARVPVPVPAGAATDRHDNMGETAELVLRTSLAQRREHMLSQGSVVSELEFTELSPEQQGDYGHMLSSLSFDVASLPFAAQCDVVKFCFHQLGVCSWYELSAHALHGFVVEAATMHAKKDESSTRPLQGAASSWVHTVRWCHQLYWLLKVGGAARFLTYFDVFAMLVSVVQVGTHHPGATCWGHSGSKNSGAQVRMSLSLLLTKVNQFLENGGGIFRSLTGCEVMAMKKKLASCLESSKNLYSVPQHPTSSESKAVKRFISSMPPSSNVAHDRSLQRHSSLIRPFLIQLLFHLSAVSTAAMHTEDIALPHMDQLLARSGVPLEVQPRRALHHIVKVVEPLLQVLSSLSVAAVKPLSSNLEQLKREYHARNKALGPKKPLILSPTRSPRVGGRSPRKTKGAMVPLPPLGPKPMFRP